MSDTDNEVTKYQKGYSRDTSRGLRRWLDRTLRRGLNPREVALFKELNTEAFKLVDEKGRGRG
jgi:hypothetical protein